jgi:hypothetical protein
MPRQRPAHSIRMLLLFPALWSFLRRLAFRKLYPNPMPKIERLDHAGRYVVELTAIIYAQAPLSRGMTGHTILQ